MAEIPGFFPKESVFLGYFTSVTSCAQLLQAMNTSLLRELSAEQDLDFGEISVP